MNEPWSKTIKKRSSFSLRDYESDIHETGMIGSWYVLVMCEIEPLLWTHRLPRNGPLKFSLKIGPRATVGSTFSHIVKNFQPDPMKTVGEDRL